MASRRTKRQGQHQPREYYMDVRFVEAVAELGQK